jgi:Fe-S-cluster containining protein
MDCDECKDKPCCNNNIMPVEVTLEFLQRLADNFSINIEEAFERYCEIAPIFKMDNKYIARLALKLPCPFFENRCTIHSIKPASCLCFPATAVLEGTAEAFPDFPCLNNEIEQSNEIEMDFAEDLIREHLKERKLELDVCFKGNPIIIDLQDLKDIDENKKAIEKYLSDEPNTIEDITKVVGIVKRHLKTLINKETVVSRIKNITEDQKKRIVEKNNSYFEIREKYGM